VTILQKQGRAVVEGISRFSIPGFKNMEGANMECPSMRSVMETEKMHYDKFREKSYVK
jgi:hypothetical protein